MTMTDLSANQATAKTDMLAAIAAMAPRFREAAQSIEQDRVIPDDLIDAMYDSGVFRSLMPREVGGMELSAPDWLEVLEALSAINASAGWIALVSAGHTFLHADALKHMLSDGSRWITAINGARIGGKAYRAEGGYRISGHWPWASSGPYADFAGGMAFLHDENDNLVIHPKDGMPWVVLGVVPKSDFTYVDTWDGLGLRGTGSGDIILDNVFVPENHVMESLSDQPFDGPLYRAVGLFQVAGHAAHALGIARSSIDAFVAMSQAAPAAGSMRQAALGRIQSHQIAVARADAMVRSARLFAWDAVANAYAAAESTPPGQKVPLELRVLLREATTYAVRTSKAVVNLMFESAGVGSVKKGSALEVAYRDMSTAAQHIMHVDETLSLSGQYWLTKDNPDGPEIDGGLMAFF